MNIKLAKEFSRSNIAFAIFINIMTFGFYSLYWLWRKAEFLNAKLPRNKLPIFELVSCCILLTLVYIYSHSFYILYFVAKVIFLFDVRDRIHHVTKIAPDSKHWFSTFWLFIFGFLYMIYKIDGFPLNKDTPENPNESS